jgi:hypothetical protein
MGKTIYITENQLDYIINNVDLLTEQEGQQTQTGGQYCKLSSDDKGGKYYLCEMQSPYPDNVIRPVDDHGNLKPEVTSFITATKCLQQDSKADYFKDEFKHDFGEGVTKDQWLPSQNGACRKNLNQKMPNGNDFLAKARQSNMMEILKKGLGTSVSPSKVTTGADTKVSKVVVKLVKKTVEKERESINFEHFHINRLKATPFKVVGKKGVDKGPLNYTYYPTPSNKTTVGMEMFVRKLVEKGLIEGGCAEGYDEYDRWIANTPCTNFDIATAATEIDDFFKTKYNGGAGLDRDTRRPQEENVLKGKKLYEILNTQLNSFKGKVRYEQPLNWGPERKTTKG